MEVGRTLGHFGKLTSGGNSYMSIDISNVLTFELLPSDPLLLILLQATHAVG